MAPLDSLPADQRAVLELVLQQGQGYDEIGATLRIERAAVRQRALAAFDRLGPDTELPASRRALITDYLLGQLPPRIAEQVRARLRSSRADHDWAAAIAATLEPVARRPLPEIPSGSPAGGAPTSRRGGAILLGGAATVLVAAVAAVVVLVTTGSSNPGRHRPLTTPAPTTTAAPPASRTGTSTAVTHVRQVNLYAPGGARTPLGVAQVLRQGSVMGLVIVATGMPANTSTNAYAVWLSNSPTDNRFLGFVPSRVGSDGRLQVESKLLPSDAASFKRLLITIETTAKPSSPGRVILTGAFQVP